MLLQNPSLTFRPTLRTVSDTSRGVRRSHLLVEKGGQKLFMFWTHLNTIGAVMTNMVLRWLWGPDRIYSFYINVDRWYCDYVTDLLRGSWSRLLEVYFPCVTYILWISTPGQGWMWWRKSRRRTALRQRRPVSSRCRRWWAGRGWNHNLRPCNSCIMLYQHYQQYQKISALSVISIISTIIVIRTDNCPKYCWRFVSLHLPLQTIPQMKAHFWTPSLPILFLFTYFPQDCGELPVEWADFFAWRKSKTALYW